MVICNAKWHKIPSYLFGKNGFLSYKCRYEAWELSSQYNKRGTM